MNGLIELFNQKSAAITFVMSAVLVVVMALSLADGLMFAIEEMDRSETGAPAQNQAAAQSTRASFDIEQITGLFGSVQQTAAPQPVNAPKTTLNLELQGIFTAEKPEDSSAIIAERGKSGELYTIGDRVPGNAILEAVLDDHVLIKRGNRTERLPFSDNALLEQFKDNDPPRSLASEFGRGNRARPSSSRLDQIPERIARRSQQLAERRRVNRADNANLKEKLADYQQRLIDDPDDVLNELGMEAVQENGAEGYRIGGEVNEAALRQVGLQQGDIVVSVNGKPASQVANNQSVMNEVMSGSRVRVEVQRGERRFFVTVPVPK